MNQKVRWPHKHVTALLALTAIVSVSAPMIVHAQGLAVPDLGNLIPESFKSLGSAVNVVWNTVVGIGGLVFLGYLLYGGFMFLTSSGDEALATKARHTIRDALIGIALVVFAWPLGVLVLTILGQQGIVTDNPGLNAPTASPSSTISIPTPTAAPQSSSVPTPTTPTKTTEPKTSSTPTPTSTTVPPQGTQK